MGDFSKFRKAELGKLPPGVGIDPTGASEQLEETRHSLSQKLWIAVTLCNLQIVINDRHWGLPIIILATTPLGMGVVVVVGIWLLDLVGARLPAIGLAPSSSPSTSLARQ